MSYTNISANQVLKKAFDEPTDSLKTQITNDNGNPVPVTLLSNTVKSDSPDLIDYSVIEAVGGNWYQLKASVASDVRIIHLFDTTGVYLEIGIGAAGSEVVQCMLGPGNDQPINVHIPSGSRIAIRSAEASAPSAGNVAINYLG